VCVVSKDKKKAKSRIFKKKKQVRIKYRVQENTKKIPVEARFFAPVQTDPGVHPASYIVGNGSLYRG
jgi:hypothetical protein